jgi:hypothetical protein
MQRDTPPTLADLIDRIERANVKARFAIADSKYIRGETERIRQYVRESQERDET